MPVFQDAHWHDDRNFNFEVVGTNHYQTNLQLILGTMEFKSIERLATLVPDDANAFDNKAVAVVIAGLLVGHLSKADARSFRRRLAAKKLSGHTTSARSIVHGGMNTAGKRYPIRVKLDLRTFD